MLAVEIAVALSLRQPYISGLTFRIKVKEAGREEPLATKSTGFQRDERWLTSCLHELNCSNPRLAETWLRVWTRKSAPSDRCSPAVTFSVCCWEKSPPRAQRASEAWDGLAGSRLGSTLIEDLSTQNYIR